MNAFRSSGENEKILAGLQIHDLARGGNGVARSEGQVIFVPLTLPGDVVTVRLVSVEKRFATGELISIDQPSPDRVKPPCPVFGICGGCTWQHVPYEKQWSTKRDGALHTLSRIGVTFTGQVVEFPAANPWNYRNRIQLRSWPSPAGGGAELGYFGRRSKALVSIERCEIAREELNRRLPELRKQAAKLSTEAKVEVEVLPDGTTREVWNSRHGAMGFRQVNDEQNEQMREFVRTNLSEGAHLLDLYGGAGNFSLADAEKYSFVECVDAGSPETEIGDQPKNYRFFKSDVARWLDRRAHEIENGAFKPKGPIEVVLDPPREGLGDPANKIAVALDKLRAARILAVGCDADSWARDVSKFLRNGWKIEKIAIFDLFPQTPHVESVAVLGRT